MMSSLKRFAYLPHGGLGKAYYCLGHSLGGTCSLKEHEWSRPDALRTCGCFEVSGSTAGADTLSDTQPKNWTPLDSLTNSCFVDLRMSGWSLALSGSVLMSKAISHSALLKTTSTFWDLSKRARLGRRYFSYRYGPLKSWHAVNKPRTAWWKESKHWFHHRIRSRQW
jgi:hypothetical protein